MSRKIKNALIILVLIFILLLGTMSIFCLQIIQFNNSLIAENITLAKGQNVTRYLEIPRDYYVVSAYINLSGLNSSHSNESHNQINPYGVYSNSDDYGTMINVTSTITLYSVETMQDSRCNNMTIRDVSGSIIAESNISKNISILKTPLVLYANQNYSILIRANTSDSCRKYSNKNSGLPEQTTNIYWVCGYTYSAGPACSGLKDAIGIKSINISNMLYPQNASLEIGSDDGSHTWNLTGAFSHSENKTSNFKSKLNKAINNKSCDCTACYLNGDNCSIPFIFKADNTSSTLPADISYSNLIVTYTLLNSNLTSPLNNSYASVNQTFTCNASDSIQLINVTLFIWNASNSSIFNSTTKSLTGTLNSTTFDIDFVTNFNLTGTYKWNCLAYNNNSISEWADNNNTINVDLESLVINLNQPTNNKWVNNRRVFFNFTANHPNLNLDTCQLYTNSTGTYHKNFTWIKPLNSVMNYTSVNISDGRGYEWTIWCNVTSTGDSLYSLDGNYSFNVDTDYPIINYSTGNASGVSGLAINLSFEITEPNPNTCFFTLRDSSGVVHNYAENTSISCSATSRAVSVLAYGTYAFYLYSNDLAGNENVSSITFTANAPSVTGGGSGGGTTTLVPVLALKTLNQTSYSELERAILYARINEYCINFSISKSTCSITSKYPSLIEKLKSQRVEINSSVLNEFVRMFNRKMIETLKVSESLQKEFNLFISTLYITEQAFALNPKNIDIPWLAFSDTFNIKVYSSKTLKSCSVQEGLGLSCQSLDSFAKVSYTMPVYPPDYMFELVQGVITYTDTDNNVVFQNVAIRIVTLTGLLIILIPASLGIFIIFKFRKNIGKLFRRLK